MDFSVPVDRLAAYRDRIVRTLDRLAPRTFSQAVLNRLPPRPQNGASRARLTHDQENLFGPQLPQKARVNVPTSP